MNIKTPAEICEAVALDFKARKITHQQAGDAIGKSKAIISNQISGKKPFSKAMAHLFSKAFGYNSNFLLYGIGELRRDVIEQGVINVNTESDDLSPSSLIVLLEVCELLLHLSNDQIAIDAWNAAMCGDFCTYSQKLGILMKKNKYNGRVPLITAKYAIEHVSNALKAQIYSIHNEY